MYDRAITLLDAAVMVTTAGFFLLLGIVIGIELG